MVKYTIDFQEKIQKEEFKFIARFNFARDVEFFFKLSCQVAEKFKLIVPYSRAFERRQSNCLVSSLFGQLDRDCGTQFIINQYQKCKDHECTNTIIIQGCSNDPLNILKVSQGLDIHQKAISGSIFDRFIMVYFDSSRELHP